MKHKKIRKQSSEIRKYILDHIEKKPSGITSAVVKKFKISRQAATRYLTKMVSEGRLIARGSTKDRSYSLGKTGDVVKSYDLRTPLSESEIWERDFKPLCEGLKPNVESICAFGFTEMVNNAIDHSGGNLLSILFRRTLKEIGMTVGDNGVGIFKKIQETYNLSDERQSILELSKGKLTTDPAKHTGEGIFFTSEMFDYFSVHSHDLTFSHYDLAEHDFLHHRKKNVGGTTIFMILSTKSSRTTKEVFDKFADPVDYSFDKTIVPVRLVQYEGVELVSRSQAKRLMARVENFKTVQLDFSGVKSVGPAFAHEIFVVYKSQHPRIKLIPINTSEEVLKMINRAKGTVLDGHFQHINNIEKLIKEGLMEPTGMGHGVGSMTPGGPLPHVYPSYRIVKRDVESVRKILPNLSLSWEDRKKIQTIWDIEPSNP